MADKSPETSEDFAAHIGNMVCGGYVTLAISVGMDTGLFDVMCEMDAPKTSQEIADLAGLKERYVREWLGAMSTARIVDIQEDAGEQPRYHIPSHRIDTLKPGGGKNRAALLARGVPMLSSVYKGLIGCFNKDGPRGLDYSLYTDFHEFMAALSARWFDNHLIQDFIPSIDGLKDKLESGIQILDVGCGAGRSTYLFAQHYPNSQVYGLDFSQDAFAKTEQAAADAGMNNLHFVSRDAAHMDPKWIDKFDFVFINDALHDQAYPDKVLGEIHRAMKPDGMLSILEPDSHTKHSDNVKNGTGASLLYVISMMNCTPVSLNFEGGMGLGAAWGREKAVEFLSQHGFDSQPPYNQPGGSGLHYLCKKKSL